MKHEEKNQMSLQEKKQKLAELLRKKSQVNVQLPLTYQQLSMWIHQNTEKQSTAYNIPVAFCLKGENLDPNIVSNAIQSIVNRQSVLRTSIAHENELPCQIIKPSISISLDCSDISKQEGAEWEKVVEEKLFELAEEPFDLTTGPLFRFELVKVSSDLHVLLATFHHLIMDGWSIGVFLTEFAEFYIASLDKRQVRLPQLQQSYSDFVKQHQAYHDGEAFKEDAKYWKQRLQDAPVSANLPIVKQFNASKSYNGAIHQTDIPKSLHEQILTVGKSRNATAFMTYLTAYYCFISRLGGDNDIVVGVSSANREEQAYWPLLGLFADVTPMRTSIPTGASFVELLEQVKAECLADYEHNTISLSKIIETVAPVRLEGKNPLFQVGFDFQNTPWPDISEQVVSVMYGDTGSAKLDINLNLSFEREKMVAVFEYNTDLFSEEAMALYADYFLHLLSSIVTKPLDAIERLPLAEMSKQSLSDDFYSANYVSPLELIQRHAIETPDAIALEQREIQVTYRDLLNRIEVAATALNSHSLQDEEFIGIYCNRNIDHIVSILAILRAGCAFIPLDPSWPEQRITSIVADSKLTKIIVNHEQPDVFVPSGVSSLTLAALSRNPNSNDETITQLQEVIDPTSAAYVIYTSGTSGTPKGVVIEHNALGAFTQDCVTLFSLTPSDRVMQFASLVFDTCIEEIFPTLSAGATLVLKEEEKFGSLQGFADECTRKQISVLDLPTAYWHELVKEEDATKHLLTNQDLRVVIIGGEAALNSAVAQWHDVVKGRVALYNTYGPTEATVSVATALLDHNSSTSALPVSVSIGRANPSAHITIQNAHGDHLPTNIYGELCIESATLARGYLHDEALTRERFGPDLRCYRSGDIARYRENGEIEILGRLDQQIKINGFRVELSDIDSNLIAHTDIKSAATILIEQPARKLASFVQLSEDSKLDASTISQWLGKRLPKHMLPSNIVQVANLPLNNSNKVDKAALTRLFADQLITADDEDISLTPTESIVAELWGSLLSKSTSEKMNISGHDDFFSLGGHSLLLIKLLSRIRAEFSVEIFLNEAFEHATVSALANLIEQKQNGVSALSDSIKPAISLVPQQEIYLQSFAQQRIWLHEHFENYHSAYVDSFAINFEGDIDSSALEKATRHALSKHEIFRTTYTTYNSNPVQIIHNELDISFVHDAIYGQFESVAEAIADAIAQDSRIKFDLSCQAPIRFRLFKLNEDFSFLVISVHHIAVDAWSMEQIIKQIAEDYQSIINGAPLSKESSVESIRYVDYAHWEQTAYSEEASNPILDYWQQKLHDLPVEANFPKRRHAVISKTSGAIKHSALDAETLEQLDEYGKTQQTTLFINCLAAFKLLLCRYTEQSDITVGTPISTRNHHDVEPVIGCLLNTLILRTEIDLDWSFDQFIQEVKATVLGAFQHQQIPFEVIVEKLNLARTSQGVPGFSVMFVLQEESEQEALLEDVNTYIVEGATEQSKFDLTLIARKHSEGISFTWEYNEERLGADLIDAMAADLEDILNGLIFDHQDVLRSITYSRTHSLVSGEYQQIESQSLFIDKFEHLVEHSGNKLALVADNGSLTFGELNKRANQLANRLRDKGVTKGDIVSLYLPRCEAVIISILATQKLNAAFLPLDTQQPVERTKTILLDCQCRYLVCNSDSLSSASELNVTLINVDNAAAQSDLFVASDNAERSLDDPAYLIYTSGSTGKPKGFKITQFGLASLSKNLSEDGIADGKIAGSWAWFAPIYFDAAMQGIAQIANGNPLYIIPENSRFDFIRLREFFEEYSPDVIDCTPKVAELWLDAGLGDVLPNVAIGGEEISGKLWHKLVDWQNKFGKSAINLYGPSECAVNSTWCEIKGSTPHIGLPVPNLDCAVISKGGWLTPQGVIGELYIKSASATTEYINQAKLNQKHFVKLPYLNPVKSEKELPTFFRTGDLVYVNEEGALCFVGRSDHQIKLHGQRIETDEVSDCLSEHPDVSRAFVDLSSNQGSNGSQLTAWIVCEQESHSSIIDELDTLTQNKLPIYMRPQQYILLDKLPLTSQGKVDRIALAQSLSSAVQPALSPLTTESELSIAKVWARCLSLDIDTLGANSDFFDLGGNSLLAIKMVNMINESIGTSLDIRHVFNYSNISELAATVDSTRNVEEQSKDVATDAEIEEVIW